MRLRINGSNSDTSSSSSTSTSTEARRQAVCPTSISTESSPKDLSSRLRRIFKGPPRPKASNLSPQRIEPTEAYTHVPTAASSAFLKTTTTTDMFELTGAGRLNTSRSMNDLSGARPVLLSRASDSRLKHIEAAEMDLSGRERGDV